MSVTTRILLAILLPALFSGLGVLASVWAEQKKLRTRGALFQGFGLVAALTSAQWAVSGWPPFPPVDVTQAFPYLGLLAILAGATQASGNRWAWPLSTLVGALGLWFLMGPKLRNTWTLAGGTIRLFLVLAGLMLIWYLLSRAGVQDSNQGPALPLLICIVSTVTSVALVVCHSAFLAQLAGAIAAGMFVLAALSLVSSRARLNLGGTATVGLFLSGLFLCGSLYASLPAESALLLACSLLALGVRLPWLPNAPGWRMWLYRGVLVVLLAWLAFYRAYSLNSGDLDEYYDY